MIFGNRTILGTLILVLAAGAASADTLVCADGDTLFGELVRLREGALVFRSNLAGQMMAPLDEVNVLTTASEVRVTFADGRAARGRFVLEDGAARLLRHDGSIEVLDLAQVAVVAPQAATATVLADTEAGPAAAPLQVSLETGVHQRVGNEDYVDLFAKLTLSRNARRYGFRSGWLIERADEDRFPRWLLANTEWRLAPDSGIYPTANLDFERDTDKALDFRANVGAGMGKQFFANDTHEMAGMAGVDVETAHFDAGSSRRDDQQLNLRLGLRYVRGVLKNGQLSEHLVMYPSLTDFGALHGRSESSVLFPFTPGLKLKLNLLVDYEENPQFKDLDKWRASLGASFLWDF